MTDCAKCGTIESGFDVRFPSLDVTRCEKHGQALQVHVASDPISPRHGHHRECMKCILEDLYAHRAIVDAMVEKEPSLAPALRSVLEKVRSIGRN